MTQDFVFSEGSMRGDDSMKEPPDGGGGGKGNSEVKTKVSFKDIVTGKQDKIPPRQTKDLLKEKLARIVFEDDNPLKPMVHIHDSVFEGLCAPWQDALVVKLLGKSIGFHTMCDRLQRIWKLIAGFEIMDIGNNYYMVKFDNEQDRFKVMEGGP